MTERGKRIQALSDPSRAASVSARAAAGLAWLRTTMTSLVDRLSPGHPDSTWRRRGQLLSILLIGTIGVCLAILFHLLALSLYAERLMEPGLVWSCSITLVVVIVISVVNRIGRTRVAASSFLLFVTMMICFNDTPDQLVEGRSTFFFIFPVMMASVVLSPASSFLALAVVVGALSVLSVGLPGSLPLIKVGGMFLVALVAWLSARSLEDALVGLSALNQDLDRRVSEQTRELMDAFEQLEQAQAERLQSMKMAAIGQLASGVAHEINNPLGVILGFAQGLARRMSEGDPLRLPVSSIVRESLRCKALVQELLTFSRTGKKSAEPIDLNELIRSTVVLLESRAKTQNVSMVQDLGEDLPFITANRIKIQQVLINLGTNAIDAMMGGGTLTLRTRRNGQDEAVFEVVDTGAGILEDVRSRIFEPFFTTKEVGTGTGLGLSLVWEILQQHGGVIDVESEVGRGTTMRVRLPATTGERA